MPPLPEMPRAPGSDPSTVPGDEPSGADRRRAPRRRLRDRIASLDSTQNPALRGRFALQNLMLLVDDDMRQTALSLGSVEQYLTASMALIEDDALAPEALLAHADDDDVLSRMDMLLENLANLRRRMRSIAVAMKGR